MSDFKQQLSFISDLIDQVIKDDDFPNTIKPECLKNAVTDYPQRGGKRLRPALLLWSCGLVGGHPQQARYAAAAVEIYHNWTLVHDDIIDNDDIRRGSPTCHIQLSTVGQDQYQLDPEKAQRFGRDFAILAGDIQQGWAVNMLLKSVEGGADPALAITLSRRLQELVNRDLITGEALDVEFSYRNIDNLTSDEVEEMLIGKTAVLLQFCAETGVMLALNETDINNKSVRKLGQFAKFAGLAFQLRDDWLGIFGEQQTFGKPICSDMSEAKPTMLLTSALSMLDQDKKAQLTDLVGQPSYTPGEIALIQTLIRDSGAEQAINQKAKNYAKQALDILDSFPDNCYKTLLNEWTGFLLTRSK